MKCYVGATFSRYEEARAIIDRLLAAGHEVTHDWTRTDAFGPDGHPLPLFDAPGGCATGGAMREVQARHAVDDLAAVAAADVGLFLGQEASLGWPVELGAMLAHGRARVLVVAPFRVTVFLSLPQVTVYVTAEDAVAALLDGA